MRFSHVGAWSDRHVKIKCGQCYGCKRERMRQWAVRIMHETETAKASSFITCTYNNQSLPKDGSIDVRHWQLFCKKLRKRIGPFRYFHCGEYTDPPPKGNLRPHYHAAIFGYDFPDREYFKSNKHGDPLYTSAFLEKTWGRGFCTVGNLDFNSAAYVAGYTLKKITGKKAKAHYNGRKPEYVTMSRRPGLGTEWFNKFHKDVYPRDEVITRGHPTRPPRFYDDLFTKMDETSMATIKQIRADEARTRFEETTPARLAVRENFARAKHRQNGRNLE